MIWASALLWFCLLSGAYGIMFWLPQMIKQLSGLNPLQIGLVNALPWAGAMIGTYYNARHSDRSGERFLHVSVPAVISALAMLAAWAVGGGVPGLLLISSRDSIGRRARRLLGIAHLAPHTGHLRGGRGRHQRRRDVRRDHRPACGGIGARAHRQFRRPHCLDCRHFAAGHRIIPLHSPHVLSRRAGAALPMITILACGDVGVKRHDAASMFVHCAPVLRAADLCFAQLETTMSERGAKVPNARLAMRSPSSMAPAVREAGIGVMSFAGNHCLDFGYDAFDDTLHAAAGAQIALCGAGVTLAQAPRPARITCSGVRIAILAASSILPEGYAAEADKPGCAPLRAHTVYEPREPDQPGTPAEVRTFADRADLAGCRTCGGAAHATSWSCPCTGASTWSRHASPTTSTRSPTPRSTRAPMRSSGTTGTSSRASSSTGASRSSTASATSPSSSPTSGIPRSRRPTRSGIS